MSTLFAGLVLFAVLLIIMVSNQPQPERLLKDETFYAVGSSPTTRQLKDSVLVTLGAIKTACPDLPPGKVGDAVFARLAKQQRGKTSKS